MKEYWLPFTPNRAFKAEPRLLASASGMHYRKPDGSTVLDATAGLWCVNAGHCREPIVAAIREMAGRLDYAPSFQFSHPAAAELATQLASRMPRPLDHVFFANSGSEAVESALKIALGYHQARGDANRVRLIGRLRGYHGVNFGGISVGGLPNNRRNFGQLLPHVSHLRDTYDHAHMAFSRGQPEWGVHLAEDLMQEIRFHGADTIAALIVEPVACSGGILVPPPGYLERLREITTEHGILLIFDEVITAFGRCGATTAAERFGVTPDLITMAKGLTNAAVPMGAVAVADFVHDAFMDAVPDGIELYHGYTYSGHPLAAAAGLATLKLHDDEGLNARVRDLEGYWETQIHALRSCPGVRDIRNFGLIGAVELEPGHQPGARATQLMKRCFERNLLIRITGDIVALSPPLIVSREQIDEIFEILTQELGRTA